MCQPGDIGKLLHHDTQATRETRSQATHRDRTGERRDQNSEDYEALEGRHEIFEKYSRTPANHDMDFGFPDICPIGSEAAAARRERAAYSAQARVKLAQQLQNRLPPDNACVEATAGLVYAGQDGRPQKGRRRLPPDTASPKAAIAMTDADAAFAGAEGPLVGESAVNARASAGRAAASKPAKPRQEKSRVRPGIVAPEEERARRKRLEDVQPKVSRLSYPFSPRGKNPEAAHADAEGRARGGIAFTIGQEAHTPAADAVARRRAAAEGEPRHAQARKGHARTRPGDKQGERAGAARLSRFRGLQARVAESCARVTRTAGADDGGDGEALGGPPSGPGVGAAYSAEGRAVRAGKAREQEEAKSGARSGSSLADIIRRGRECRRETGPDVQVSPRRLGRRGTRPALLYERRRCGTCRARARRRSAAACQPAGVGQGLVPHARPWRLFVDQRRSRLRGS